MSERWKQNPGGCDGCRRGLKINVMGQHYVPSGLRPKAASYKGSKTMRWTYKERFVCTNPERIGRFKG